MIASWRYACLLYDAQQLEAANAQELPVAVCGMLARLLHDIPEQKTLVAALRQRLLDELAITRVQSLDSASLAIAIDGLQACASEELSGELVSLFAGRLLKTEVAVGGPYRQLRSAADTATDVDPVTNACVVQCLRWLAAPPPPTIDFVAQTIADIDDVDLADLGLFAALQQHTGGLPYGHFTAQLLGHLPLLTAAMSRSIMHAADVHIGNGCNRDSDLTSSLRHHLNNEISKRSDPFQTNTRFMLEQVLRADTTQEISQFARYYGIALAPTAGAGVQISGQLYDLLGVANVYAWAAYTIYHDFLDEQGQPTMLGTANYSLRAMVRHYCEALPDNTSFHAFVEHSLAVADQAHTYETSRLRMSVADSMLTVGELPDYGSRGLLADRALFHILGPMAVLAGTGKSQVGDAIWDNTLQALRQYLIARQLNDDIHDWVKDLQTGQATYVVVELLRHLDVVSGVYNINELLPYARTYFWQDVLPRVCETALGHIRLAHSHLDKGLPLTQRSSFMHYFDYVEQSMLEAQNKRLHGQALLAMFKI